VASKNNKSGRKSGISDKGNYTEKLFQRLTSFPRTTRRKDGDFIHLNIPIEVKKVSQHKGGASGTINQIRSLKNSVLVVRVSNRRSWLVVGPREVLKIISSTKSRGQHCESPFECSNLTVKNLLEHGVREVSDSKLKNRVSRVARKARMDEEVKFLTNKLLVENQTLARRHITLVNKVVKGSS